MMARRAQLRDRQSDARACLPSEAGMLVICLRIENSFQKRGEDNVPIAR